MKFMVTMKDADGIYDSICEESERLAKAAIPNSSIPDSVVESLKNGFAVELGRFAKQWLESGEYVTIEFDTEAGTATVLKTP